MKKKDKNKKTLSWGLLTKRERWGLTWKAWLLGFFTFIGSCLFLVKNTYNFLAPTERLDSKILVVEGWLDDDSLEQAVTEFRTYNYDYVYVTGGPIDVGSFLTKYKNYAEMGSKTLKKLGIPESKIIASPGPDSIKDRTYSSALALKKHFEENNIQTESINLFSSGPHSKRSQLLFKLAFNEIKVGVIASEPFYFDTKFWWKSSAGFRFVIDELIAFSYALIFKYTHMGELTGLI